MIVEDDKDIRSKFERALASDNCFRVIASEDCLEDAMNSLQQRPPDVLLVDIGLPDGSGIELIRATRQLKKKVECMVVTIHADYHHLMKALESGATGYLLKDALPEDICETVRDLLRGGSPISPLIARALLKRFEPNRESLLVEHLTARETEVLKGMVLGLTRKEIADKFSLSVHTVHSHIKNIYGKLQVNSNISAVQKARELHLINEFDI